MTSPIGLTGIQRLEISVTCEACGTRFTYPHELLGSTRSVYAPMRRSEAGDRLARQIERLRAEDFSDLPPHPCPTCGALQSWMLDAARRRSGERGGCALALALGGLGLAGVALPGPPALDLISGLVIGLVALGAGALADRALRRRWKPARERVRRSEPQPPEVTFL